MTTGGEPTVNIDLVRMGVLKRKLTRAEAAQITSEVMELGLTSSDARFTLVIIKAMKVTG